MKPLSYPFLVHPVVLDARLYVFKISYLAEFSHLLELILAKDTEEGCRCHVEKPAIGNRRDTDLAADFVCLICFTL